MGSKEFAVAVRPGRSLRLGIAAGVAGRFETLSSVWLGLCWGLCVPLLSTVRVDQLFAAYRVSLPACLLLFVAGQRLLAALLRRGGQSRAAASRRVAWILAPLWIAGFAPLALFVPARSLPALLFLAGGAVALYRLTAQLHARFFSTRPRALETLILTALFLSALVLLFQVRIVHDAFQYYGYLVSVALDGDLNLYDQIYLHNAERFYNPFPRESARYLGTAVLQTPFFVVGHLLAIGLGALGRTAPLTGYTLPYGFLVTAGSSLFGLAGLVATYRLSREFFPRAPGMIATVAVWLASPLVFFMFVWGGWAHPVAFCFVAWFLLHWQRTRRNRSLTQWATLGLLGGLLLIIRPPTAIVAIFPLLEWLRTLRQGAAERSARRGARLLGPLIASGVALVVFSPQFSLWKAIGGSWLAMPYNEVGDFHDWLHPDFAGLLFAPAQHGLVVWTPLMLVAAAGIVLLFRVDRLVALGAAVTVLGTTYLYACWSIWWTGIGFSNRFFVELAPVLVLGLAALLQSLERRLSREWIVGALALVVTWNLILVGAYRANDIPQGIPDPWRVVGEPLGVAEIASSGLQITPPGAKPDWTDWAHDGFFTGRAAHALTFSDRGELLVLLAILLALGTAATLLVRILLRAASGGGATTDRTASSDPTPSGASDARVPRGAWVLAASLTVVAALHGGIWLAASRDAGFGRFHHLPEINFQVGRLAADSWVYNDSDLPVSSIDLLTQLAYGHGVPQDAVVATVTVFDRDGREFTKNLRAGVETAEASYPREEFRDAIRHGIAATHVARSKPTEFYSARTYETLTYHSVFELPEPVVVSKIRFRYVYPVGRLIVSDIFLRGF